MRLIADLHLHSHYSRATSKDLDLEHLSLWAQRKGVQVVATGDISHPGWLSELKAKLEPAEEGLFRLRDDLSRAVQAQLPGACQGTVRFMLAGEISNIYKKGERVRKVHNVVFAPSLAVVEKLQARLERIGNIRSDGRPILGLDSRDLLDILLSLDPQAYLIPAHIWTPWFSMLGSMSGFDSVEECFGDLTAHIFALETGLSSDPPMNWRVSNLDRYTLVSNSDAHSPPKLAREATVFDTELSYPALFDALKTGDAARFGGTLEFFPEEGKYHYDGHRKCEVRWEPETTRAHQGVCQVCGKPVTVGVMHRVEELADRPEGGRPARVHPYHSLIPLPEILAEVYGVGAGSRQVEQAYETLLAKLGPELGILRDLPLEDIARVGGGLLAEGVRRVRTGQLTIAAGYDGEYGTVHLFSDDERATFSSQLGLFGEKPARNKPAPSKERASPSQPPATQADLFNVPPTPIPVVREEQVPLSSSPAGALLAGLNEQQREAVLCDDPALIIVAGPGTGKTRTLTHRIAYLVQARGVAPENILAITFTNKAAGEMAERLVRLVGPNTTRQIMVKTFHAFGAWLLRQEAARLGLTPQFAIYTDDDRRRLLQRLVPDLSEKQFNLTLDTISAAKNRLLDPDAPALADVPDPPPELRAVYRRYEAALHEAQALDFDDLIYKAVRLL
ncbi:MAG: UvrD-helicase domain-containing protein, partial [Anaerolineae bacterium]|nr:UvrD-helicase domain-containing protein [Anaerolineae bacterium]